MPLIDIHLIKDAWTPEQKQEILQVVTNALVNHLGESSRPLTWSRIIEVENGDWWIGGKPFTIEDVDSLLDRTEGGLPSRTAESSSDG